MFRLEAKYTCNGLAQSQRGSALAIGLVFLLIMTLIGVTSMTLSTQQEKMSGNFITRAQSSNRAESIQTAVAVQLMPLVEDRQSPNIIINDSVVVDLSDENITDDDCGSGFLNRARQDTVMLTAAATIGFDSDQYMVVKVPEACLADTLLLSERGDVLDFYWVLASGQVETTSTVYGSFVIWIPKT